MKAILLLSFALISTAAFADDVAALLTEAQRAYIRGERAEAKSKFDLILKMEPDNRVARQYMRRILTEELKEIQTRGPANATEGLLKTAIIPKVEFVDASLAEALEFLRQKGNQAIQGKGTINFVMKLDEATKNRKITLSLQSMPVSEVMRYVGQVADVEFVYEPFAIVVQQKKAKPAPQPAVEASAEKKIPGL